MNDKRMWTHKFHVGERIIDTSSQWTYIYEKSLPLFVLQTLDLELWLTLHMLIPLLHAHHLNWYLYPEQEYNLVNTSQKLSKDNLKKSRWNHNLKPQVITIDVFSSQLQKWRNKEDCWQISKYLKKTMWSSRTLIIFDFFPRLLRVLVSEAFTPSMWVPPSIVRMLLAYPSNVSEYASEHLQ